eukprot:CAMPEP_0178912274 /NCGR_PEP_ID=MMETSP0786-20121207/10169_1 /TAXON_ID=186022 /ORGANISM="Thalassionema frauenfeldii, Strain CCMP 1798" /LENGTH=770 /DNA_ID=CAMNT_0020584833 /DNA_START=188 /DNA_END=2500 /DNA_ORIENTATION=+
MIYSYYCNNNNSNSNNNNRMMQVLLLLIACLVLVHSFTTTIPHPRSSACSYHVSFATPVKEEAANTVIPAPDNEDDDSSIEEEAEQLVQSLIDDECEVTDEGLPADDELCLDEEKKAGLRSRLKGMISKLRRGSSNDDDDIVDDDVDDDDDDDLVEGDLLELGWEKRGRSSAIRRNAEIWKFALQSVFQVLKPRKLRKKGNVSEEEVEAAQRSAAEFIRNGLLRLGPSFVKLGQVAATRTDVLGPIYIDVLKTLQDDVPAFSGTKAKEIVSRELGGGGGGRSCDEIFSNFSETPLKAASLGQVHTAILKETGHKVAIKVQRAGLKELFDVDLKNLEKLAVLLDKLDPKTDGADRDWVSIYRESARLLYQEIDYELEATNAERFRKDFETIDWVRVPRVYREYTTPRVLTMEFVESFKLTDLERIEELGLDKTLLAQRTADAFLRQIVETSFFHCDPHPGNLCVDDDGNLVYYDFGMMDELKPNVRNGFRTFCTALFRGGPMIGDLELAQNAKDLVKGVEEAGVLAQGADQLAVEKLARYFMRTFKNNQLGNKSKKKNANVKEAVGTDLQTLTENNVFRFPSTFTFIFRAFASVDGIGKGLTPGKFEIGQLAQPFIEKFIGQQQEEQAGGNKAAKQFNILSKATGLNPQDINTAISSPKKIAYIEDTLRNMEGGDLKIRVRSLENEKALERVSLQNTKLEQLMVASLVWNVAGTIASPLLRRAGMIGAAIVALKALVITQGQITKFDKTQAKFVSTKFKEEEEKEEKPEET